MCQYVSWKSISISQAPFLEVEQHLSYQEHAEGPGFDNLLSLLISMMNHGFPDSLFGTIESQERNTDMRT